MTREQAHRKALIDILKDAYSGELAAALAYSGHWRTLRDPEQRAAIQQIEQDEWDHRQCVGELLRAMGERPASFKDIRRRVIGTVIALGCRVVGWFIPMFFAGRLEGQNICAYDVAAPHAAALGLGECEKQLLHMAEVERQHEAYFHSLIAEHRWFPMFRKIFGWGCDPEAVATRRGAMEAYRKSA